MSSAASTTAVIIGNWSKYPSNCSDVWTVDNNRSISGVNFINTATIDFRPNGDIYGVVSSTNNTVGTRICQIPTKLGSFLDFFTVTQCAGVEPPTPTCTKFLDSCCGYSTNHPDYDVSMDGNPTLEQYEDRQYYDDYEQDDYENYEQDDSRDYDD